MGWSLWRGRLWGGGSLAPTLRQSRKSFMPLKLRNISQLSGVSSVMFHRALQENSMTWSHCGGGGGRQLSCVLLRTHGQPWHRRLWDEAKYVRLSLPSCPAASSGSASTWSVGGGDRLFEARVPTAQELSRGSHWLLQVTQPDSAQCYRLLWRLFEGSQVYTLGTWPSPSLLWSARPQG